MPDQREILMQYLAMLQAGKRPALPAGVPQAVGSFANVATPGQGGWSLAETIRAAQALKSPPVAVAESPQGFGGISGGFSSAPWPNQTADQSVPQAKPRWLTGPAGEKPPGAGYDVYGSTKEPVSVSELDAMTGPMQATVESQQKTTKPTFQRPPGEKLDLENPEHQKMYSEAKDQAVESVKQALEKRDDSDLTRRDRLLAMRDIAAGLSSWKPSVAADYLLTGGPPEQPAPMTDTIDLELAKEEDLKSGDHLRRILKQSGIEMPPDVPMSAYESIFPYLAAKMRTDYQKSMDEQATAEKAQNDRTKRLEKVFYSWQSNAFNNSLKDRMNAAEESKLLLREGSTDSDQRMAIRSLLRLSGDKRLSNIDISDMRAPWDTVGQIDNFLNRMIAGELQPEYRQHLQQSAEILEEVARRGMDKNAEEWAQGLSRANDIPYEDIIGVVQPGGKVSTTFEKTVMVKNPDTGIPEPMTESAFEEYKKVAAELGMPEPKAE